MENIKHKIIFSNQKVSIQSFGTYLPILRLKKSKRENFEDYFQMRISEGFFPNKFESKFYFFFRKV